MQPMMLLPWRLRILQQQDQESGTYLVYIHLRLGRPMYILKREDSARTLQCCTMWLYRGG